MQSSLGLHLQGQRCIREQGTESAKSQLSFLFWNTVATTLNLKKKSLYLITCSNSYLDQENPSFLSVSQMCSQMLTLRIVKLNFNLKEDICFIVFIT